MSAHTPGPWKEHFEEAYYVTGPDLGRVAMMMNLKGAHGLGGRRTGDESAANCRLIAAAPDLLQALEDMLNGWKYIRSMHGDLYGVGWDRAQDKADAAIRAAKGAPA